MADQRRVKLGKDDLERGMPIDAMVAMMKSMEEAGMGSTALFDSQAVLMVEGGTGLAPNSIGASFIQVEGGIAVFMDPGSIASIERGAAKPLHAMARLSGQLDHQASETCPYTRRQADIERESIHPLAAAWLESGQRGSSSETLCRLFFNAPSSSRTTTQGHEHPHDPSDLRRCVLFLEATGTQERIPEAAALSPEWAALCEQWQSLTGLLAKEMSQAESAPLTYAAMRALLAPAPRRKAGP